MTSAQAIDAAKARGGAAFVGYLPVGFPDLEGSIAAARELAAAGADVIEVGIPYSDPSMDGGVIQAATTAPSPEGRACGTRSPWSRPSPRRAPSHSS